MDRQCSFKKWLKINEEGTGTNSIAVFARPIGIGMIRRKPIEMIAFEKKKKKKD